MCFSGIKFCKGYKEQTENAFNKSEKTNAKVFFTWSPKNLSPLTSQGLSECFLWGASSYGLTR